MRLALIHNVEAGSAGDMNDLVAAIERHGHTVVIVGAPAHGVEHLLPKGLDAVVAAGGDGTIASAALALRGCTVPLAILPMGTANNIAASLGVPRAPDDAIASWAASTPRRFDTGVATGAWGARRFVESTGGGLVTHGITVMDRRAETSPTIAEQLQRALQSHLDVLELMAPARWTGTIDGTPFDGDYLLIEVLNTAFIGPNLALAPQATPHDGHFTVVAAGADDREALAAYLRDRIDGGAPTLSLPTWPATEVIIGAGDRLHVDDAIVGEPAAGQGLVRIVIEPGALLVLAPPA